VARHHCQALIAAASVGGGAEQVRVAVLPGEGDILEGHAPGAEHGDSFAWEHRLLDGPGSFEPGAGGDEKKCLPGGKADVVLLEFDRAGSLAAFEPRELVEVTVAGELPQDRERILMWLGMNVIQAHRRS